MCAVLFGLFANGGHTNLEAPSCLCFFKDGFVFVLRLELSLCAVYSV